MKNLIPTLFLLVLNVGCTTYPKNYTYSPTVTIGGDNTGGLALPSPYAKKPQPAPAPQPPTHNHHSQMYVNNPHPHYNNYPEEHLQYDEPLYIVRPSVRIKGQDGVWR